MVIQASNDVCVTLNTIYVQYVHVQCIAIFIKLYYNISHLLSTQSLGVDNCASIITDITKYNSLSIFLIFMTDRWVDGLIEGWTDTLRMRVPK